MTNGKTPRISGGYTNMMTNKRTETHACDCISRQAAIHLITGYNGVMDKSVAKRLLIQMPSEQPEQEILSWLLAYHTKSFELHGRYMPHEVIGWLVHDFANAYMAERREE